MVEGDADVHLLVLVALGVGGEDRPLHLHRRGDRFLRIAEVGHDGVADGLHQDAVELGQLGNDDLVVLFQPGDAHGVPVLLEEGGGAGEVGEHDRDGRFVLLEFRVYVRAVRKELLNTNGHRATGPQGCSEGWK